MVKRVAIVVLIIFVCLVGAYVWFMGHTPSVDVDPTTDTSLDDLLVTSPLEATYSIDGEGVILYEESADEELVSGAASRRVTQVHGDPVVGDLNDDGLEDTALILTRSEGGSGTFYYVVAALKSSVGYYGTNGIFLGDRIAIDSFTVRNGILHLTFRDYTEEGAMAAPQESHTKYFTIHLAELYEVDLRGAQFLEGTVTSDGDTLSFAPCSGTQMRVSNDSPSLGALRAITEAGTMTRSVFVTVLADAEEGEEDELRSSYTINRVLTAPRDGSCTL